MASSRAVLVAATGAQASVSLVAFGLGSIGPAAPRGATASASPLLGAMLTANLLGSGLFVIPAGVAVDRYGARPATLLGTALGVAGLAGAAFAPSAGLLIAFLFLSGVGSSIVPIAGMGAIFRAYGAARRAWALGVRQMGVPLGGVTSAVALPLLAHAGGVRLALLVAGRGRSECSAPPSRWSPASRPEPGAVRQRIAVLRILLLPGMGRLLAVAACYIVVLQAVLAYAVPSARDAGLSVLAAGAVFFALQVGAGVARIAWGRIADSGGGGRRTRTLAEAGWVGAAGALLFAVGLHAGVAAAIPAAIVLAFGALGWNALVYVIAGERVPLASRGAGGLRGGDGDLRAVGGRDSTPGRARRAGRVGRVLGDLRGGVRVRRARRPDASRRLSRPFATPRPRFAYCMVIAWRGSSRTGAALSRGARARLRPSLSGPR